ncbi:MAG: EAL domain-containing protein [Agathobacter sp.]|nr:EAL domain-containing protein [Agathobacter sp.]
MVDVLFDFKYVLTADVVALLLCIVVHFLLHSTYMAKKANLGIFKIANILVAISAVASVFYHYMIFGLREENIYRLYFCRALCYTLLISTYVCFCVYIRNLVEPSKRFKDIYSALIFGGLAIFTVVEFVGPYFKIGYYVDENIVLHQNYYTDPFRYAYVYYGILMAFMLIKYRKKFLPKMYRCIWSVIAVAVGLMAYQAEFLQTSYTVVSFTFPIIMVLFLFHYNSYDVKTGTLDNYAFEEYVEENKEKSFSMIFLSLPNISRETLQVFSEKFLRKNDSFFESSCCFRLQDNHMVLVYEKEKNKNEQQILDKMYQEFEKVREKSDFQIVMMDSNGYLLNSKEYITYCQYTEERMPMNSIKKCDDDLLSEFLKYKFIYLNLQDIDRKGNLNDYRVKVFCQPVLNIKMNTFSTAEALMRLEIPEVGMVFPDQFIGVAESENFIHTLSKIILNKTCQNIKHMEEEGFHIERVSVNFSVQELHLENFCDDIIEIIEKNGVAFDKIAIELTETRNEKDFLSMKKVIERLQVLGIKFYLDDFGTGYSNFERLIGLPIDIIKFDRSLTILASKNDESKFMVGSFSEIFKKADYQILFEGVEDERDEKQCINMNAQYLQGYKYSKPIPMENLKEFLEKPAV